MPAAAAAAALHLLHWRSPSRPCTSWEPHLVVSAALQPQHYRLTRRVSQPPRHRAAHLAVVARGFLVCRVAPRQPPSPATHFTRASPTRVLQPNEPCPKFWVGIADVLHIMAERFMNTWEETPWRTLGRRRMRLKGRRWLDGNRGRRSRARPGDGNTDRARQPDQQAGRELRGNAPAI